MIDVFLRRRGVASIALASALVSVVCLSAPAADTSVANLQLPDTYPRLLLNSNGIVELKQRLASAPWAKKSWTELENSAAQDLSKPVQLPPRGGNWSHNYVCPTHGARLSRGKQLGPWQWEHFCPVGNHRLLGDPGKASLDFDGNAIASVHGRYAEQTVEHGLVYQLTGDIRHARKAREILLAYADRYLQYPLHDNQGKAGKGCRVASQSLTEASWLIDITQGADLVWTTLSPVERDQLANRLLRPALDQVILPRRMGIHNIQCRHNSAIGLVGFLLNDRKLISIAIEDPARGYKAQLAQGVLGDGMWLEGASGYHFFTIAGLWPLAEAARNCGMDLYTPAFQRMFDGPLALAMPDFVLPNFNDSGTVALEKQADAYELAYARFHRPAYAALLAGSSRRSRLALLYGATELPKTAANRPLASHNLDSSGYAVLQRGEGKDATWLCLKYGPHGGGHGHPDKNSFILYAGGNILGTDAGTHAYGSPLHRDWDKTTLAHNTLTVDEASQKPAAGRCIAFGSDKGVEYASTDAGAAYDGVRFIRTTALVTRNLILFVDQVRAESPHTYDVAYHQIGRWAKPKSGDKAERWVVPSSPGYNHLTSALVRSNVTSNLTLATQGEGCRPAITLAANEPTQVITAYGLLKTTEDLVPVLLQRRTTKQTAFVWAVSIDGTPVNIRVLPVKQDSGRLLPACEATLVELTTSGKQWSFLVNPDAANVTASPDSGHAWTTRAAFSVQ